MSMQIVEKSGEGLSRVYGVLVPVAELNARLDKRLAEVTPQVQLKGFRPGKVPASHVRKMYGKGLMQEVVEQAMDDSQRDALEKVKLRPAASPDIKMESDIGQVLDGKADLAFELAIEVMPEFQPIDPGSLILTRMVHTPTDAEVMEALTEIAEGAKTYETKGGKTPKAADGDMIVMDFVGSIDGVKFDGGSGEDAELVIGSGRFIPGFEEQLKGAKAGEEVTVKVNFPNDYGAAHLAGKAAEFAVTVKEVKAAKKGKVDDALAERLGLGDLDSLKKLVSEQLGNQNAGAARFKLKRALLDQLDSSHDFPLPPRMVEGEFETIWSQVEAERASGELAEDEKDKTEDQLKADYRKIAERRVRLGLVLAEIGREHGVVVSDQELHGAIVNEARRYPGQEAQVMEAYRNRQDLQAALRAPLYEEKVVDLIISKAKVEDQEVAKDVLFEEDDLPAGYGS